MTEYDPFLNPSETPTIRNAGFACAACGYDLTGAMIGGTCPECGTAINLRAGQAAGAPHNGLAIASMVCGILSLVLCIFYGIPTIILGPLAITFAVIAKKQFQTGRYNPGGKGMAQAGLICGIISLCLLAMGILAIVLIAFNA